MLRHPRHDSLRDVIALGLAAGCFFVLSGCDSSTAPSRSGTPNLFRSPSLIEDSPEHPLVIVGTGDPSVDVPVVQAAVDQGGDVVLKGHFSFDAPPTKPLAPVLGSAGGGYAPAAEILIAKSVSVSGARDEDGGLATIDAGTIPFYVEARGERVTIRGLRFVRPTSAAILVYAVTGLEIASTRIAGVVPFAHLGGGIAVNTSGNLPNPTSPGNPQNISGSLRFERNDIDMIGGTSADNTLGITVFSAGVAGAEVDAHVAGNRIRNTTEPAINFRRLVGHADIEHNVITTGSVFGTAPRNQTIRVANIGSYLVAHNSITCEWALSDAEGIGVFSQFAAWPVEQAVIVDNDIHMRPPEGTVFTAFSAGIAVYGFAQNNVVRHNTIHGAALAALSIPSVFPLPPQPPATPQDNAFIRNRFVDFTASDADVFVGNHALRTRVVGRGTVDDQGTGTIRQ
jgi:hypothetical protein